MAGTDFPTSLNVTAQVPLDGRTKVADLTERDALPEFQRYEGMLVYVVSEQTNFQLVGGITNSDWQELSGSGGGGVGGGLVWRGLPGFEPFFKDYANFRMHEYESGGLQSGIASFKVPDSYTVGGEIKLRMRMTSEVTSSDTVQFMLTSGVLDNSDILSPITGSNVQNIGPGFNANEIYDVEFEIADSSGEINGYPVQPGDIISLTLSRPTHFSDEAPEPVLVLIDHMEVLFL